MTTLPDWYPDAAEAKPAPAPLLRVQAFLNTRDLETQTDLLADPDRARPWLEAAGLLRPASPLRPADLAQARRLRESIRGLLPSEDGAYPRPRDLDPVRELAQNGRPRLEVDRRGVLAVESARHDTLADGLFDLLLIIRAAQEDGTWTRLKACANPDCGWAFYDRSRNQHGSWCDMAVCGNRLKNRSLRERRR